MVERNAFSVDVPLHLFGKLSRPEQWLDPQKFGRIHRRRLVSIARVVAAHRLFDGTYELELRDGTRLSTERRYKNAVDNLIGR